jgi:hypothetical protein
MFDVIMQGGRKEVASCTALLMVALVWFGFKLDGVFKTSREYRYGYNAFI